jgi:aminoglycoside phosphotransferase (APT) family kinase protein
MGVAHWLADSGVDVTAPLEIHRVGVGQSNITSMVVDAAEHCWVLREPPPGASGTAHDLGREARVLDALAGCGVPVPTVVARGSHPDGRVYFAMSCLPGVVLESEDDVRGLEAEERAAIGVSVVAVLARLHAVDSVAVGLGSFASATPYVVRQLGRLGQLWDKAGRSSRHDARWQRLRDRLGDKAPRPSGQAVVHGDYRLSNLLVANGAVTGVLDWELAAVGDPLADLAWLLDDWRGPDDEVIVMPSPTRAGGFGRREDLLAAYTALSGREIGDLDYYRAFTQWRAASLLQGVLARRRSGVLGDQGALDLGLLDESIAFLLTTAEEHLR